MTQREHVATGAGLSQCDAILAALMESKGKWVGMPFLATKAQAYAVHSRIAELRKRGHKIDAMQERRPGTRKVWSYYRLALDTSPA